LRVTPWVFLCAAVLLSVERICYLWIWWRPEKFQVFCTRPAVAHFGAPIDVLQYLFYTFKVLQCAVFIGWCYVHGNGSILTLDGRTLYLGLGAVLIVAGQALNVIVFCRLGKTGVFYGNKFGYDVSWCREFPFSIFDHPQYAGALLSIWGFFLATRFPHEDWWVLPALETVYYSLGARFER